MIQRFERAKRAARERAERTDEPQFVIRVAPGDADPRGGYVVADIQELEDFWHAADRDILYATA